MQSPNVWKAEKSARGKAFSSPSTKHRPLRLTTLSPSPQPYNTSLRPSMRPMCPTPRRRASPSYSRGCHQRSTTWSTTMSSLSCAGPCVASLTTFHWWMSRTHSLNPSPIPARRSATTRPGWRRRQPTDTLTWCNLSVITCGRPPSAATRRESPQATLRPALRMRRSLSMMPYAHPRWTG